MNGSEDAERTELVGAVGLECPAGLEVREEGIRTRIGSEIVRRVREVPAVIGVVCSF